MEDQLDPADQRRLLAALAVGFGTEAAISLTDVAGMEPEEAIEVMATTCRWILAGALAEAAVQRTQPATRCNRAPPRRRGCGSDRAAMLTWGGVL